MRELRDYEEARVNMLLLVIYFALDGGCDMTNFWSSYLSYHKIRNGDLKLSAQISPSLPIVLLLRVFHNHNRNEPRVGTKDLPHMLSHLSLPGHRNRTPWLYR